MKALERELGVTLFHRRSRGVELTEPGRALAAAVREALDRIARGVAELHARPHRALTVSVLPAFATHWLIPRLADFNRRHPDIDINVRAGSGTGGFFDRGRRSRGALWRRHMAGPDRGAAGARGRVPGVQSAFNGGRLPKTLAELAKARLLHTPLQPWDEWFHALGMNVAPSRRGMTFGETDVLLRARDRRPRASRCRAASWRSPSWMPDGWCGRCGTACARTDRISSSIPMRSSRRRGC